ncbi:phosphatidylinositol 4-kinase type II subunit alpha [Rhodotorula toruloides]|uniref:Phosphatidylinositol 4-kinase n=1 Tax=Rhodotorula toruloides TaxID=5286 RepID=A0A511KKR5_RHOTO|nr:phosphatidylinositol 4-kinase type II subunit alpha [Rhodotorula toruloides]
MRHEEFEELVSSVRLAISRGTHPRLNAKGSSGSYFARAPNGETVGVFKPADEEPYGTLNPKMVKWIHRNFLSRVIPFGRACLVPRQSYLSESAASILDRHLGTNIVPRTEVVAFSSPAFYYDWIDREKAKRGAGLREKEGSFQVFLKGFKDVSDFLYEHPFPSRPSLFSSLYPYTPNTIDRAPSNAPGPPTRKDRRRRGWLMATCLWMCGMAEAERYERPTGGQDGAGEAPSGEPRARGAMVLSRQVDGFEWSEEMVASFRHELEKLVILDFSIRNTDRGLDNFMARVCYDTSDGHPPHPHFHLAAIDNSLAFPHQHPFGWRAFLYGWLNLPLSLVGQPWSASTRKAFLPKLSDPGWWRELRRELRREFKKDKTFREDVWERQWAVVKGQGWNLVQSLTSEDEGPVELCRRPKMLVREEFALTAVEPTPSVVPPFIRRQDSVPLPSTSQDDLPSPSSRPSLWNRRTAPPKAVPPVQLALKAPAPPPKEPPAPPPKTAPIRVARRHRRTQSDWGAIDTHGSTLVPSSAPAPNGYCLRRPLESLSSNSCANGDSWGDESEEETGVGLMQRLDRVEADERKRLRKARRKDKAVRDMLDAEERGGEEGMREVPRRSWLGRSWSSSAALVRDADEGGRPIRRSYSDEAGAGESTPLLRDPRAVEDRMTQSWYGGYGSSMRILEDHIEVDEEEQDEATLDRPTQRVRRKWVIVEHLEEVKEPERWVYWPW